MNEQQVVDLMETSRSSDEWNANCDKVKAACGGDYPNFWYSTMIQSGRIHSITARWGGSGGLRISTFG